MRAILISVLVLVGCGEELGRELSTEAPLASAGSPSASQSSATGGQAPATGGSSQIASGGTSEATGGSVATGGASAVQSATGGATMVSSAPATGGAATGGAVATGGSKATGGTTATGGAATGGAPPRTCPVGITTAEYVDANGQCYSRAGVAHDADGHSGTLIGYQAGDIAEALAQTAASSRGTCERRIVFGVDGEPLWCGNRVRLGNSLSVPLYDWDTRRLPVMTAPFWTLTSIEFSDSGGCTAGITCRSDLVP